MLHEGILDNSTIPPADAINLAATVVPTIELRLGAIKFILFSRYYNILFFESSK